MLNVNKGEGVVTWIPRGLDNYRDDGTNVVAVSLWTEAGLVGAKSGFITITEKKVFFTPANLVRKHDRHLKRDEIDLQLKAAVPEQSKGFTTQNYSRYDDFSTSSNTGDPDDGNFEVISDEHEVLGNDAAKVKDIITDKLRSRIKNSAIALMEYSRLLSRPRGRIEIMTQGGVVIGSGSESSFGKKEIDSDDVQRYREAYCECERVYPEEIEAARRYLTSDKAFIRMRQRQEVRKLEAADLRCGLS